MRDPARIPRILGKLRAYWLTHADLRLGQIVSNAARDLTPGGAGPAFYMEDDDLDAWLTGDEPAQRADQHDKAGPDWQTERAKFWGWHISIDTTKPALERLARALLLTGSGLRAGKCSRLLSHYPFGRGISAEVTVEIPDGKQDEFREIAKPIAMEPPIRPRVGFDPPPPDDWHPGRSRP